MIRVIVSPEAQSDLHHIIEHLAGKAGTAVAARYAFRFDHCLERIADFQEIGAPRPELARGSRSLTIAPYVLIYAVEQEGATVLRILHGKRDLVGAMGER